MIHSHTPAFSFSLHNRITLDYADILTGRVHVECIPATQCPPTANKKHILFKYKAAKENHRSRSTHAHVRFCQNYKRKMEKSEPDRSVSRRSMPSAAMSRSLSIANATYKKCCFLLLLSALLVLFCSSICLFPPVRNPSKVHR